MGDADQSAKGAQPVNHPNQPLFNVTFRANNCALLNGFWNAKQSVQSFRGLIIVRFDVGNLANRPKVTEVKRNKAIRIVQEIVCLSL